MKMEEGMEFSIEDLETRKVNIFPINDQTYYDYLKHFTESKEALRSGKQTARWTPSPRISDAQFNLRHLWLHPHAKERPTHILCSMPRSRYQTLTTKNIFHYSALNIRF